MIRSFLFFSALTLIVNSTVHAQPAGWTNPNTGSLSFHHSKKVPIYSIGLDGRIRFQQNLNYGTILSNRHFIGLLQNPIIAAEMELSPSQKETVNSLIEKYDLMEAKFHQNQRKNGDVNSRKNVQQFLAKPASKIDQFLESKPLVAAAFTLGAFILYSTLSDNKEKECQQVCMVEKEAISYKFTPGSEPLNPLSRRKGTNPTCECIHQKHLDNDQLIRETL